MNHCFHCCWLLLLLGWSLVAQSGPLVVGGELTLTDDRIVNAQKQHGADFEVAPVIYERLQEIRKAIKKQRPDLKVDEVFGVGSGRGVKSFRVVFKDGFWLRFGADPYVVEVSTKPSSVDYFADHADDIQKVLFDLTGELGLKPHRRFGMGHFNVDVATAFNERSEFFRDFLVDMYNHPELAWGVFATKERGGGVLGAPHILDLSREQQEAFREMIRRYDAAEEKPSLIDLAAQLEKEVYYKTVVEGLSDPQKYQGVNVKSLVDVVLEASRRIELRWLHPQQNFQHFVLISQVMESRLDYLIKRRARQGEPLPMDPQAAQVRVQDAQQMLDRYYDWTQETGLEWAKVGGLVQTKKLRKMVPSKATSGCPLTQDLFAAGQFAPL